MEPHKRAVRFVEQLKRDELHESFHGVHPRNLMSFEGHRFVNQFFKELDDIEKGRL